MTETNKQNDNGSQMRETALILNVAVARIEHAMTEGNDSFTSLSHSFIEMVNSAKQITLSSAELEDSTTKDKIEKNCKDISQHASNSIIAFQFYDKLSQRMTLVSKTLSSLNELLKDSTKIDEQKNWGELHNKIRSKYTLDSDQEMFDAIIKGVPIDEALKTAVEKTTTDDIEFF